MGIKLGEAILLIRGNDQLEKDLAGVKKKLSDFGGQVGDILGKGLAVGAGALAAGGAALGAVLVSAAKDAMLAEQIDKQLDATLKSTGKAAEEYALKYAAAQTQVVKYSRLSEEGQKAATKEWQKAREEYEKLPDQLTKAKAKLADMEAAWVTQKTHTQSGALALSEAREKVQELTAAYKQGAPDLDKYLQMTSGPLSDALKMLPPVVRPVKDDILDIADRFSALIPIEDDVIVATESMLLTFTNIGKGIFQDSTEAVLDMATAMNNGAVPSQEQLKTSAIQLGKALNDPVAGITALTKVGVTFSDAQKIQIEGLVATGDLMGAQKVILQELQTEFGGSARAAGETFAGQLTILQNQLGNVKEEIGAALLPVLSELLTAFGPELKGALSETAKQLSDYIVPVLRSLIAQYGPQLIVLVRDAGKWIVTDLVPAIITTVKWIVTDLVPAVILVVGWLRDNLIPVIIDVANWIGSTLIPAIVSVIEWLQVNLPPAIATAQRVFNDVAGAVRAISDAIRNVIEWIQRMIERLQAIRLPSWLTPGSPTPFELGLRGIADAMGDLVGITPPAMGFAVAGMGGGAGARYAPASITINQAFGPGTAADVRSAARQGVESALSVARARGLL